jgi:hypothetical protein
VPDAEAFVTQMKKNRKKTRHVHHVVNRLHPVVAALWRQCHVLE